MNPEKIFVCLVFIVRAILIKSFIYCFLALWKRIKTPQLILNSEIKNFIWNIICAVDEISCYVLNAPRAELIISEEPDTADIIKGNVNQVR